MICSVFYECLRIYCLLKFAKQHTLKLWVNPITSSLQVQVTVLLLAVEVLLLSPSLLTCIMSLFSHHPVPLIL